jgi:hypothetical protein
MKETQTDTTNNYPEPSPELIDEIRKRLADLPQEVLERAHHAFMHDPIQEPGSILYKAGLCLGSHELYEYRKTLFPPNALLDPDTQGPPVLRSSSPSSSSSNSEQHRSADNLSVTDNGQLTTDLRPPSSGSAVLLAGLRSRLLHLLSARATHNRSADSLSAAPLEAQDMNPSIQKSTDPSALLSDLRDVIKRYVVLPELAAETLALWVVHTYAFTLRQVTTYIGVVSPEKRCGKTTLLELLGGLANRSLTAANISPSAMFRVIEETQPTLLIDEADTFLQGRDELAGILNAGYRKGNSYVVRVADRTWRKKHPLGGTSYTSPQNNTSAQNDAGPDFTQWSPDLRPVSSDFGHPVSEFCSLPSDFAKYSCWCPKVMAAIGRLPDTLADRCIIITMQRKMAGEKCERMRHLNATELRQRCAQFVQQNSANIAAAQPEIPPALNDRAADIWEPLLAIADLAGGEWPQLARQAAQKLCTQDDELTLIGYFLKDLRNLMVLANADRMLCREIVVRLNPIHSRPWEDLRRGREINEWWLGRLLGELGLRSKTMRANDAMGKGYMLADIDAAFRRYVPNPEMHTTLPPAEATSSDTPDLDADGSPA